MIKAFLFDWGGVMSIGGRGGELEGRLADVLHVSTQRAGGLLSLVWADFSRGHINEEQLWSRLEEACGQPIAASQRNIWNTWKQMSSLPEMATLVTQLKASGYQVGLISNTIPSTAGDIRSHGGYDIFDFTILSYEVGFAKPDKEIYDLAMQHLPNVEPSEIVFVDDQERCLISPREMGWGTILAVSTDQVLHDIESLLASS